MLEWLKPILGDAYTEEIDTKIAAEIGKGFVSRSDFNEVSTAKKKLEADLKERDKQLEDLSGAQGATDELKAEIARLQNENKQAQEQHQTELTQLRMSNAVDAALTAAGAKNVTAAKALLAEFLKDAQLDEDGTVKGLSDAIEGLSKAEGTSFMFEPAGAPTPGFKGMTPGNPGGNPPHAGADAYEQRLAEARKSGNTAAMVAIKREAAENGVYLM